MRVTITCEECGRRHRLERSVIEPGAIWIICHDCELPLRAVLEHSEETSEAFRSAWSGTLEISPSEAKPAS